MSGLVRMGAGADRHLLQTVYLLPATDRKGMGRQIDDGGRPMTRKIVKKGRLPWGTVLFQAQSESRIEWHQAKRKPLRQEGSRSNGLKKVKDSEGGFISRYLIFNNTPDSK